MNDDLRDRWLNLWARLKAQGDGGVIYDTILLPAYNLEPNRHYHTLEHVGACLDELEASDVPPTDVGVELALWFHDVIYVVGRADNEVKSGDLANRVAQEAKLPMQFRLELCRHIDATDHQHDSLEVGHGARGTVVDIDLAILGKPRGQYREYQRQIREEYCAVPDDVFFPARKAVLEKFLAKPLVYQTTRFQDLYEVSARRNLIAEITEINERLE